MSERNEDPTRLINWFDDFDGPNQFAFLSNFFMGSKIDMGDGYGPVYLTGEHAFQAYKARTVADWKKVVKANEPGRAKHYGRKLDLRPDWETVKYDVMRAVLAAKFTKDRYEGQRLIDTLDAYLVEGTMWNDRVWGINIDKHVGRNWLGELLMARRAHLHSGLDIQPINAAVLGFCVPTLEDKK